jgi:16S rRNA (guanine527-N7)-methyltransferase
VETTSDAIERLADYYELLRAWNSRLHLVAPCSPREFARRHILESLLLLPHLPRAAKVADIGSGAGLPIIPCLIARADITATLIESSKKKAVFLREALNHTQTSGSATVIARRFEEIESPNVEFVTCRALERFTDQLPTMIEWAPPASTLLLFGGAAARQEIERAGLLITEIKIPNSERRFLFVARRIEENRHK